MICFGCKHNDHQMIHEMEKKSTEYTPKYDSQNENHCVGNRNRKNYSKLVYKWGTINDPSAHKSKTLK